ncbi:FecR domain-containing protein [Luteimonas aestuarii]|nr:FecR domain-containing protein [Luteimonas aestuarii]
MTADQTTRPPRHAQRSATALSLPSPRAGTWRCAALRVLLLLPLALACWLVPASVDAQEWRYRIRPGDTVWDLASAHMRQDIPWERLQSHNAIEDPLRLVPGRVMSFPVAWLRQQPAQARVIALSGDVQASRDGSFGDAFPAVEGLQLGSGAALRTTPAASLTLAFADGSQLQLKGDSELHLDRLSAYGATGMVDTRLRLPRGRASSKVTRSRGPASRFSIDAPGMMSSVRGTEFRVGSDGIRSRSEVVEGRVMVSGGGRSVAVDAGRGTALDADGRPRTPIPLLAAPDLSAWPREIMRMPADLQWTGVPGAVAYRLQASAHDDFRTLLQDSVVADARARFDVRSEGLLHVRLRAIDAHGLEGFDASATVHVAAQPAPPFAIAPTDRGDAAGPRPRLRWTAADAAGMRYRVQLDADGTFNAPLVEASDLRRNEYRVPADLPPGGYAWRVGAIDGDGRHGPWSDAMRFTLRPPGEGPGVDAETADGTLQVRWRAGDAGQRYRFQLSRDASFAHVVRDEMLDDNSIALPGLRAGTWYMRVRAVDSDGYEHPYGPAQVAKVGCLPCRILAGAGGAALILLVL